MARISKKAKAVAVATAEATVDTASILANAADAPDTATDAVAIDEIATSREMFIPLDKFQEVAP